MGIGVLNFPRAIFDFFSKIGGRRKNERSRLQSLRAQIWLLQSELSSEKVYVSEARRQRLDLRRHNQAVLSMLNAGEVEKAKEYLCEREKQIEEDESPRFCRNSVLNSLLENFSKKAAEQKIECDIKCAFPEPFPMSDTDLCTVFGNIFENALESCAAVISTGGKAFFSMESFFPDAGFCVIFENSALKDVAFKKGVPRSKKSGGLGARSVIDTVKKYGGAVDFSQDGGIFLVKLILPMGDGK